MSRPVCIDLIIPCDVLLELILVPSGICQRLCSKNGSNEPVVKEGNISVKSFLLGKYPITLKQWDVVMGQANAQINESSFFDWQFRETPQSLWNCTPVLGVNAEKAAEFCVQLSRIMQTKFELPTEDQWEFACRCGKDNPFPIGDPKRFPERYYGTRRDRASGFIEAGPLPGTIPPNEFGLIGMQGYIREWCISTADGENQKDNSTFILCGSSSNSNYGEPSPPWYRGGSNKRGFDKAGGYGFRVKCDVPLSVGSSNK